MATISSTQPHASTAPTAAASNPPPAAAGSSPAAATTARPLNPTAGSAEETPKPGRSPGAKKAMTGTVTDPTIAASHAHRTGFRK